MSSATRSTPQGRMDPWVLARHLAVTVLHNPAALKKVLGHIRARDHKSLAQMGQLPDQEYHSDSEVHEALALRQVASLFKKNDAFSDDLLCSEQAMKTFLRGEKICRITNKRLDHYYGRRDRLSLRIRKWLDAMERNISMLLGDVNDYLDSIPSRIKLTSGASQDRTRRRSYPFLKITGKVRAPRAAMPYLGTVLQVWGVPLSSCRYIATEENTVVLVPKNWKTHRTIAKEPTHSLPFQLSLDSFLKEKLKKWGIDLSSQVRNQDLARQGSIDGSYATIDLEMASDTLSFNAVAWMLPFEWFEVFKSFRSSSYRAPWGRGEYAKFSSMGNGYTFTLETLIFAAACRAVGSRQYAVYGDDIAIETRHVSDLVELLSFLGFTTNAEKSFSSQLCRFRESCGCDWYKGRLVTPFYLREVPFLSDFSSVSHVVNGLVSVSHPGPLWEYLSDLCVKLKLRLVPFNEDTRSGVFITPHTAWTTKKLRSRMRKHREHGLKTYLGPMPVFDGYAATQHVRKTHGWRSLMLWHINAGSSASAPTAPQSRAGATLLTLRDYAVDSRGTGSTRVSVRVTYHHKVVCYRPVAITTPGILPLWDECLGAKQAL